jgi:hypothetical protein
MLVAWDAICDPAKHEVAQVHGPSGRRRDGARERNKPELAQHGHADDR